jgi:hypothetical protein
MAEGEILIFLQDHLHFEGDWLEGIQAAIESAEGCPGKVSKIKGQPSNSATCVYLPRILHSEAGQDSAVPSDEPQISTTARQLLLRAETRALLWGTHPS